MTNSKYELNIGSNRISLEICFVKPIKFSGNTATFRYETSNMLLKGITAEATLLHEYFLYISHRPHTLRLCVLNQPIVERKRHEEQQITGV